MNDLAAETIKNLEAEVERLESQKLVAEKLAAERLSIIKRHSARLIAKIQMIKALEAKKPVHWEYLIIALVILGVLLV